MDELKAIESVWQYPRPPRLESTGRRLRIEHRGTLLADTVHGMRVLETSHPPVYYLPQQDLQMQYLVPSPHPSSTCEWKGQATYWTLVMPGVHLPDVAWSYARPTSSFAGLKDHLAFYAGRVDRCTVDGEVAVAQPGDFYGGWITSGIRGPFKGTPGTLGW